MPLAMPERIALKARLPHGEDGYWALIRKLDDAGPWSVPDIERETCDDRKCVSRYVRKLVKAGIAAIVSAEVRHNRPLAKRYRLARSPKPTPRFRADGTAIVSNRQECLWRAMRALRSGFTVRELAFAAALPTQTIAEGVARTYVELLADAGYLVLLKEREGRNGLRVWRLKPSMNTGPLSPTILRMQAVFDRNLRQVMGDEHRAREVTL